MKRKNREINIFSMSALDLFASAMGAFMLIALVSLPYYLNTSKSAVEADKPDYKELIKVLEDSNENLEAQLQQCIDEKDEELLESLQQQNSELQEKLEDCEKEKADLEAKIVENNKKIAELEKEKQAVEEKNVQLEQENQDLEKELEKTKTEFNECDKKSADSYLLVTINWIKNNDIDLHVTDPDGLTYYYKEPNHPSAPNQTLSIDTQGGPGLELFVSQKAKVGTYKVQYHYYPKTDGQNLTTEPIEVDGSISHKDGKIDISTKTLTIDQKLDVGNIVVSEDGSITFNPIN